MTFPEMKAQAELLGFTSEQMLANCRAQLEQYRRLSQAAGDMWDVSAGQAEECLAWLSTQS